MGLDQPDQEDWKNIAFKSFSTYGTSFAVDLASESIREVV